MGLRVPLSARRRLRLAADLIGARGELLLAGPLEARRAALALAEEGDAAAVSAGALFALDRLEGALRYLLEAHLERHGRGLLSRALAALEARLGRAGLERVLRRFAAEFERPGPGDGGRGDQPGGREELLLELLLFWLIGSHPAARPLAPLLFAGGLESDPDYLTVGAELERLLSEEPPLAEGGESLLADLRAPLRAAPESLREQLGWALEHWASLVGDRALDLRSALDLLAEEEAPRFPPGPGPAELPAFEELEGQESRYSPDRSWMPRLVLLAKNCRVWLHQLSARRGRSIRTLDAVPDEELERIASWGITGLWLIGVWERSRASARIKRLCGFPVGGASAYSVFDYRIAADLGGEEALAGLRRRAARFGIRLAADMVPNHTGIDSRWVLEHPERFLGTDTCPFPSYRFSGPDLSPDPRVGIYLEDHYRDRSDAAVVFKRVDRRSGRERFIYHGNDGTGTPWNDTAQLDFLNPETREAVTRAILGVAREFPIIRFDAAMTLARSHVQRLWYPEPGRGGAIPSRAEHALERPEFERAMPREFWREVVERVAVEAPETLLLAEAFWLMESYFVRSLGMHRVYNSAFMNMLRDGENAKYRKLIKETLAFDPEILKRFVNFLSNPDERTAIMQFGRGDRYFGACVLMATLPGVPMFAHGQIEGLSERYGMEFQVPLLDERPDRAMVERHERTISPLLRERHRFAGVEGFVFYDAAGAGDEVDENLFAFSCGPQEARSLVLFNNRAGASAGRILEAAAVATDQNTRRTTLAAELGIGPAARQLYLFRDRLSGLEFLRRGRELANRGLEIELGPFQAMVLVDFVPVDEERWGALCERLAGRGAPDLELARRDLELEPVRGAVRELLTEVGAGRPAAADRVPAGLARLAGALAAAAPAERPVGDWEDRAAARLRLALVPGDAGRGIGWPPSRRMRRVRRRLRAWRAEPESRIGLAMAALALSRWPRDAGTERALEGGLADALERLGGRGDRRARLASLLAAARREGWLDAAPAPGPEELSELLASWLERPPWRDLSGGHAAEGSDWVVRERLEELLIWRGVLAELAWRAAGRSRQQTAEAVVGWFDALERVGEWARRAGYRAATIYPGGSASSRIRE